MKSSGCTILGCGTDIVEISRLRQAVKRWQKGFLERVFTPREIKYAMRRRFYLQHLAGRFAAKEAILKALGDGFSIVHLKHIEIINNKHGQPEAALSGPLQKLCKRKQVQSIMISISHSHEYATAMAILTKTV